MHSFPCLSSRFALVQPQFPVTFKAGLIYFSTASRKCRTRARVPPAAVAPVGARLATGSGTSASRMTGNAEEAIHCAWGLPTGTIVEDASSAPQPDDYVFVDGLRLVGCGEVAFHELQLTFLATT